MGIRQIRYDRELFEKLVKKKKKIERGYFIVSYGGKKIKMCRILMSLKLDRQLSMFEIIHHRDKNKLNDALENLEILSPEEHASLHFGGKRKNKPVFPLEL